VRLDRDEELHARSGSGKIVFRTAIGSLLRAARAYERGVPSPTDSVRSDRVRAALDLAIMETILKRKQARIQRLVPTQQ